MTVSNLRPLVVAIDGPAGAGKSTTAREVARCLSLRWVDTGAMYRAVTLWLLRNGVPPVEGPQLARALDQIHIDLTAEEGVQKVLLCGEDVTTLIRDPEVSRQVSRVAELPHVRATLVRLQREVAAGGGVVMEGRDIGTVVFPDAAVKVFLSASLEERTSRRAKELAERGDEVDSFVLQEELRCRDAVDSSRSFAPLRAASDAVLVDTTKLTFDEQVSAIVDLVRERGYCQSAREC